jgi:hypothetical protein
LAINSITGLVGLRDTLRFPGNVWLMNISDPFCAFQPLALTVAEVKKGCAVCDKARLEELLKENVSQANEFPDMSEFNPGQTMPVDAAVVKKEFADLLDVLKYG